MSKTNEAKDVGIEKRKLTPEQEQIVQLAESCATVFALVERNVPSNHGPAILLEIKRVKAIIDFYAPPKPKKTVEVEE